jgi:transcriptional regulator with XRE-family HTH domain
MIASPTLTTLGNTVSNLRLEKGLSQENLAETTGLDRSYISRIERGTANPTFIALSQIAEGLSLTLNEFMQLVCEADD